MTKEDKTKKYDEDIEAMKARAKSLAHFHTKIAKSVLWCILYVFIWMITGFGYFWPIWIILVNAAKAVYEAMSLGLISGVSGKYSKLFDFITTKREEELFRREMDKKREEDNNV